MGSKPEIHSASNIDDAIEIILKLVTRLIKQEGVKLSSIAILSKNASMLERAKPALFANRILFSTADKFSVESITLDTVLRFKGMESPFVLLFADRDLADHEEMSYVATSRARSHLYIVGNVSGTVLGSALELNF